MVAFPVMADQQVILHLRRGGRLVLPWITGVGLLWSASLGAHAAEPAAPDRLPSEVQGVVGSGDQLSLRLKDATGERTIAVGEAYAEGWTLTGLTPIKASLAKEGVVREVGLNPTGTLAPAEAAAPPSTVRMAGMTLPPDAEAVLALTDDEIIERLTAIGRTSILSSTHPGLSEAENRRLNLLDARRLLLINPLRDAAVQRVRDAEAQGIAARIGGPNELDYVALLGPDYLSLTARYAQTMYQRDLQKFAAIQESQPIAIRVPLGQPVASLGLDMSYYRMAERDASGVVYVLVPPAAPTFPIEGSGLPPPVLTPEVTASMRTLSGAGPADDATLIVGNQQFLDQDAAGRARLNPPGVAVFGPFGQISLP
ncbi:MAG: hypothetical protein JWM33_2030 [Caulobacteraceae bacterium]|nr:hypothetical protein [Caulobacteraceae bacterium]